jgi:hypothetical protein
MQELERRRRRRKGFQREMQHHRTVFANRIEHDRSLAFGNGFPKDLDTLGLEAL